MVKVTVIIPIYGVEKYIERCARSLFEQTLDDIEYIFVDDNSPDKSIEILNHIIADYPHRRHQIKIFHHNINMGLPVARKTGFQNATGDFIIYCDSDDWVDNILYEEMYNVAISSKADIVVCNSFRSDGFVLRGEISCGDKTKIHDCINDMMHGKMWWSLCNKLFKKEVYDNVIYTPSGAMGEDMCVVLQLITYCKQISYCLKGNYYYYNNANSIVHSLSEKKCLSNFYQNTNNVNIVLEFYKEHNLFSKYKRGLRYISFKSKRHLLPLLGKKEIYDVWRNTYFGVEFYILFDYQSSLKEKVVSVLSLLKLFPLPRNKYSYLLQNTL